MPEGPSIVILKEEVQKFKGKKVLSVSGNTRIEKERMLNEKVLDFRSCGKQFFICFKGFSLRVHFLLFGSYRIDELKPNSNIRLQLKFKNGELNLYAAAIRYIEEDLDELFDWTADVMNDNYDPAAAAKKLKAEPEMLACDALLNQNIFSGSGNIIKNEVLYRIKVHPASQVGNLPPKKLKELANEARNYSFDFLEWKKAYVLKKHWLAHTKKTCSRCAIPLHKEYMGTTNRRTFFCSNCQKLY